MKLLALCSALDTRYRLGCTPGWWQYLKGLHEQGHEVIAIPYLGQAFDTPWWRCYPNPCHLEGEAVYKLKRVLGPGSASTEEGISGKAAKVLLESWIRPRWERHLLSVFHKEHNIDALILFGLPANHYTGIPDRIRSQCHIPVFFFDGDIPASLPRFNGFASGFKGYQNACLGEYDGVMCNSEGGSDDLLKLGARWVKPVHWGVDPELYAPISCQEDFDILFYGYGTEYRETWIDAMITQPARMAPEYSFAIGGTGIAASLPNTLALGDIPYHALRQACCRSRISLSITRQAHATVFASSSLRLFELAAMGRCIVSNPQEGVERWFEPGVELMLVDSASNASDVYKRLLADESLRRHMGEAARKRILQDHTHRHRASEIINIIKSV